MVLLNAETYEFELFSTVCKAWSCPACGPRKTWLLCQRCQTANPNRFVTLTTCDHETRTPREVFDSVRRQIPELWREMRRHYGDIQYCRILETHKSGYPHFHFLVRGPYIPQKHLSHVWEHLARAFRVDIRKIWNQDQVAKYVAKYIAKQTTNPFTPQRVTQSRNFFPPVPPVEKEKTEWLTFEILRGSIVESLEENFSSYRVEMVSDTHGHLISGIRYGRWDARPIKRAHTEPFLET